MVHWKRRRVKDNAMLTEVFIVHVVRGRTPKVDDMGRNGSMAHLRRLRAALLLLGRRVVLQRCVWRHHVHTCRIRGV